MTQLAEPSGFGRERRLRKRPDFQRVQTTGARVHAAHYLFLVQARPGGAALREVGELRESREGGERKPGAAAAGPARLGIVATKKLGNAVVRNRVKRVCRACFRALSTLVPRGIDLVVIPRQGAEALGLADALVEWRSAARNLATKSRNLLAQAPGAPHVPPGR